MQNSLRTDLRISLKQSQEDIYEVIDEIPREHFQRCYSVQVRVKPVRSQVLTSKPNAPMISLYESIDEESDYGNIFPQSDYENLENTGRERGPTLPPRELQHQYAVIHDGYSRSENPEIDSLTSINIVNDAILNFNSLPLVKQFDNTIDDIQTKFKNLRNELNNRENYLIKMVEEEKEKYKENVNKHIGYVKKINNNISKLEATYTIRGNSLQKLNELNSLKYNYLKSGAEENCISFHMQNNLANLIRNFGEIREEHIPQYHRMHTAPQYRGKAGNGMNEIDFPMGLAVDQKTNNVYVVDQGVVPKVCIVTPDGKVQMFGKTNGCLIRPHGICVKNGNVYVTDNNRDNNTGMVLVYNMKGKFLGKCEMEGGMKEALGISVDDDEDIYVCDGISNSIHVFDKKFNWKEDITMLNYTQPLDIKVTDSEIYVLAEENNRLCLLIIEEGKLIRDILDKDTEGEFGNIQFFTMDNCGNITMADQTAHCLRVYSKYGNLVTNITGTDITGLSMPNGVDINRDNNVVTSWLNGNSALRVF
ncbi:hypothetical protein LOD99_14782 [Oopsacas minuta]|uniref:Uncharacterized protein n=1 Tax=Oopsacas minuta TaxID=111878 RepID=A0AAV7KCC7_9METZ|nr:hypothetical protein LOD99_14782 [Oopsacas minuta]